MEVKETCKICGEEVLQNRFGFHIRKHKILVVDYYQKYYPRTELLTGQPREYKDREGYFLHDFDSRSNLVHYLTYYSTNANETYAISLLGRHARARNLVFMPSQVELRTSILPARNYYEKKYGSYSAIGVPLGLRSRYEDDPQISVPALPDDFEIWYDTREQTPLRLSCATKRVKLDFGDYTAAGKHYAGLFIERKSLVDFVNTLSQGYERFQAEIQRARAMDSYLVVLIEDSLKTCMHFRIPNCKASPPFIFHRLKELMQTYDNIQFVFADGRPQASELATEILLLGERAKTIDIQYAIERKLLCGKNTPEPKL